MGNIVSQDYLTEFGINDDSYKKFVSEINELQGIPNIEQYKYDVIKTIPNVYKGIIDEIKSRIKTLNEEFSEINVFDDDAQNFRKNFETLVNKYNLSMYQIGYFTKQLDKKFEDAQKFSDEISEEKLNKLKTDIESRKKLIRDIQAQSENDKNIKQKNTNFKSIENEIGRLQSKNKSQKETSEKSGTDVTSEITNSSATPVISSADVGLSGGGRYLNSNSGRYRKYSYDTLHMDYK
jgi:ATP-dependent Lon protease